MTFMQDEFISWLFYLVLPATIFVSYALPLRRWSGRRGWFGPAIIVFVGLGFPFYAVPVGRAAYWIVEQTLNPQGFLAGIVESIALLVFLCGAITGAGLYAATMSRLVLVATLGASTITAGVFLIDANLPEWSIIVVYVFWHSAVFASMWWWAKRERIRNRIDNGACASCGYDLSGLRADVCPECGGAIRAGSASARCETPKPPESRKD